MSNEADYSRPFGYIPAAKREVCKCGVRKKPVSQDGKLVFICYACDDVKHRYNSYQEKRVARDCLKCDSRFIAMGDFNRVCDSCKNGVEYENETEYSIGSK